MFEVGKKYDLVLLEDDAGETLETTYPGRTVTDVDGHLIKINENGKDMIINTASSRFVRAVRNG